MLLLFVVTVLMVGLAACNIGGSDEEQLEKVKVAERRFGVEIKP